MISIERIERVLEKHPNLVKSITDLGVGYDKKYIVKTLLYLANNFVLVSDHDGVIRDTDEVKDACLIAFCIFIWGELIDKTELPTEIHRRMHGLPMGEIFVEIAEKCYNKKISREEGELVTKQLNDYIRPEYIKRKVYDGAVEFLSILKEIGMPCYILTGMEPDMIEDGLKYHKIEHLFDGILGAPKTKAENLKELLQKYPGRRLLGTGNALSEYKATYAHEGTRFLAFCFDGKNVFPEDVNVLTSYGVDPWLELFWQLDN